jgi:hypothetical protein
MSKKDNLQKARGAAFANYTKRLILKISKGLKNSTAKDRGEEGGGQEEEEQEEEETGL